VVGAEPLLERRIGREDLDTTRIWDDGSDAAKSSTPYLLLIPLAVRYGDGRFNCPVAVVVMD